MTVHQKYGQTWWGSQWLNALSQIDFDNRLPRGRSYANKGWVTKFDVDCGTIRAQVQGSRVTPYKVEISVPQLSPDSAEKILDRIGKSATTISKMLNRELDPVVLEYTEENNIAIFPSRWSDLQMKCSCPDWAVPCKHIAAVIYLMAKEIDGNPFLVFSLRGIDLIDELKGRDIFIESTATSVLPTINDLLFNSLSDLPEHSSNAQEIPTHSLPQQKIYQAIDYSQITDLKEPLIGVLNSRPTFFQSGDFRTLYQRVLSRMAKSARDLLDQSFFENNNEKLITNIHRPEMEIDSEYRLTIYNTDSITTIEDLILALRTISEDDLPDLQPEITTLFHIQKICLQLLAKGAIIPQIFQAANSGFRIRWLPALIDQSVTQLLDDIVKVMSPKLLFYKTGSKRNYLSSETVALTLCSLMLDGLVTELSKSKNERPSDDEIVDLFFGSHQAKFSKPGQGSIPKGISIWLSRLHVAQSHYSPVLLLKESRGGFSLSLGVDVAETDSTKPVPLSKVLTLKSWNAKRYEVLQRVSLLSEFFPSFDKYISSGAQDPISLSPSELPEFLFDALPIIRLMGIKTMLPKALDRLLRPRLSVRISGQTKESSGFVSLAQLLGFSWQVAIGSTQISKEEFEKLVKTASGIVKFRDEYVYLDPNEIESLRKQLENPPKQTSSDLLRIALAEEYRGSPIEFDEAAKKLIESLTKTDSIPLPPSINAELRPYQRRGYEWLYKNIQAGFGSIIADDMGLGKTLQVITTIAKLKDQGQLDSAKSLVVVPTTLLTNWSREIEKFAPSLTKIIFHGAIRRLPKDLPDVVLTTYGVVRTDLEKLKKYQWKLLVADEAQNIKNPFAAQSKSLKSLPAQTRIAMSGTPVENRLSEYWSIMDFANHGLLGTLPSFTKEFAVPIQSNHDQDLAEQFKRATAPFLLRRLKTDKTIINDLPDKVEQNYFCELSEKQAALYESVLRDSINKIQKEKDDISRQGLVLQMILALKQICNHPAQYLKSKEPDPAHSGKTQLLLDLLEPIYSGHEKVIIFTQFREMGELLTELISKQFGHTPQFLHGGLSRKQRDSMVVNFQEDPTIRSFILSLKAGGTGLNLTAASNVIHYDLWWNPAVEQQATDRAYRIGQHRNVGVFRLITRDTFEERINDMINSKRDLAEMSVGVGEKWIGNLNNQELKELFALG